MASSRCGASPELVAGVAFGLSLVGAVAWVSVVAFWHILGPPSDGWDDPGGQWRRAGGMLLPTVGFLTSAAALALAAAARRVGGRRAGRLATWQAAVLFAGLPFALLLADLLRALAAG